MKKDMDKIVFESRTEIDEVANALEKYVKEHGENETIKKLIDLLDAMYMSW